jgi:phosphoribosylaminoimidazole-succinocarboxamide synthase
MIGHDVLRAALSHPLDATSREALGLPASVVSYEGKVRDNYSLGDGRRVLVTTDRISAFDRVLGTLPLKGQVLNRMSHHWFELTKAFAPNHVLSMPDPNVLVGIECRPLPVEMVVRSYLTGVTSTSVWTHYARGERVFAGHALPDGLKKNEPLPQPILTPSTKADKGGHDVTASRAEILAEGKLSEAEFDEAARLAMALFRFGQERASSRGLILVDTKYEFGIDPSGTIRVIDEIHTPDSSRYWFGASYEARLARSEEPESFDKEYVRRWLASVGFTGDGPIPPIPDEVRIEAASRYVAAYEAIVGERFEPELSEPLPRMKAALAGLFG